LRRFRKTGSVGAEVTSDGRLFQRRHPATGNAPSYGCVFIRCNEFLYAWDYKLYLFTSVKGRIILLIRGTAFREQTGAVVGVFIIEGYAF